MTIVLRHSEELDLNRVDYAGAVTLDELAALAAYGARHPLFLRADSLNLVLPGAAFSDVETADLDALFVRYAGLYAPLDFQIYRRAAWVCQNPAAAAHVAYWVAKPALKETLSSAVRCFESFADAADWLLLSPSQRAPLESGETFTEITCFENPPRLRRAAAG